MNMEFIRKLPIPKEIKEEYPVTKRMEEVKAKRDAEIRDVFEGKSSKLAVIIGPCSADCAESMEEYLARMRVLADKVSDKLVIIPRIYTGKPRTTGEGYKGMIHQPNPEEKPDMLKGILAIRDLHMHALRDYDFSCADEMLYPENHRYLNDLLSYVAVGARSVEDQHHRMTASGFNIPVGMKNPTSGDLSVMMNAITAGQHSHDFIYRGWEVHTHGNPLVHAILRGYTDSRGNSFPNYHYEDLEKTVRLYAEKNLQNPGVIVDTNHANSGKKYAEQPRIAKDVLFSCRKNPEIKKIVKGLMIESYLEDGAQKIGDGVFGKSITDPCIGWEKTERLVLEHADLV
ncbi:MAG: 3-deoxy-7-phosphoheptulonate synthase [Clostridia bacterium]|nr:3-deoxy-7-phosphoheptulonate synthase [Clostridia bacterium]